MKERELLINTLSKEKKIRQEIKNRSSNSVISQPLFFVGSKYSQELTNLVREGQEKISFIDFSQTGTAEKTSGQWIEKEIERVCKKNNQEFSLLCFLNLNEISGTALEKALLPFFDYHQNTRHRGLDLSPFILIVTASTLQKLSPPLVSRLKCVNQQEVELPKSFLDKHFNLILVGSVLVVLVGLFIIFWPFSSQKST